MKEMVVSKQISVNEKRLLELCRQYHVASLKIFGSMARGEGRIDSDIDILVSFTRPISLIRLVRLERELSQLMGRKVDLVTEQGLSPYIRPTVLASAREIYELPR